MIRNQAQENESAFNSINDTSSKVYKTQLRRLLMISSCCWIKYRRVWEEEEYCHNHLLVTQAGTEAEHRTFAGLEFIIQR